MIAEIVTGVVAVEGGSALSSRWWPTMMVEKWRWSSGRIS